MQGICILGSTGSIGTQTLEIIAQYPDKFRLISLAAKQSVDKVFQQCVRYHPEKVVMSNVDAANRLKQRIQAQGLPISVFAGDECLNELVADPNVDRVMASMSGACGLVPVLTAIRSNKVVMLANKEPIVMAGRWVLEALKSSQGSLLPVDSEHNSIFQVLSDDYRIGDSISGLDKIILTASGGPFWQYSEEQLKKVTLDQALKHPTWQMGRKITIDSATLMNKGLELIEAKWLFALNPNQLDVLIHPQSIVHSFVCYHDGAQLAQLGVPDMRLCIAYCMHDARLRNIVRPLDLANQRLEFFPAPLSRFKAIQLALDVVAAGNEAACVFNAANEVAVEAFLNDCIAFGDIINITDKALQHHVGSKCDTIDDIMVLDTKVRNQVLTSIQKGVGTNA